MSKDNASGGPPSLPSGRQYVLTCGVSRVVVVEVGAGLRSYVADGRELLDGYGEYDRASDARGQVLVPWPNRLGDGQYTWDGEKHQLPLTEPSKRNAIHGLARWARWSCRRQTTREVELVHALPPQPGYPFALEVAVGYSLTDDGLTVTTTAGNVGSRPLPYAAGQHPYLSADGLVDECRLEAPGSIWLSTDERGLPTGSHATAGSEYDFRQARLLGDTQLDVAFGELHRDAQGRAWVRLLHPEGAGTQLWVDESYPYVELFTGDTVADPGRRRRGLGVEPMTAPPNALATGTDVIRLEPGQTASSQWGLSPAG